MKKVILIGIAAAGFGCSSNTAYIPPVRTMNAARLDGYRKDGNDTSTRRNSWTGRTNNVRTAEVVKAYGVNRYVDPADPRVMHERHAIYRIEESPGWVVQTPQGNRGIILGPVVGLKNPEDAPVPKDSEIKREILVSRQALEKNNDELKTIRRGQESMGQYMKQSAEAQGKLALIVDRLNQRLERVEQKTGSSKEDGDADRDERTIPQRGQTAP